MPEIRHALLALREPVTVERNSEATGNEDDTCLVGSTPVAVERSRCFSPGLLQHQANLRNSSAPSRGKIPFLRACTYDGSFSTPTSHQWSIQKPIRAGIGRFGTVPAEPCVRKAGSS